MCLATKRQSATKKTASLHLTKTLQIFSYFGKVSVNRFSSKIDFIFTCVLNILRGLELGNFYALKAGYLHDKSFVMNPYFVSNRVLEINTNKTKQVSKPA
jgi:hypothetical protein